MNNNLETLHGVSGLIFFTFFFQSNKKIQVGTKLSVMEPLCYIKAYSCSSYKILNRSLVTRRQALKLQFLCLCSLDHVIDICEGNMETISESTILVSVSSVILLY